MKIQNVKVTGDGTPDGTHVLVDGEKLERVQRVFTQNGRLYITVGVAPKDWSIGDLDGEPPSGVLDSGGRYEGDVAIGADFDISVRRYDVRDPRLVDA